MQTLRIDVTQKRREKRRAEKKRMMNPFSLLTLYVTQKELSSSVGVALPSLFSFLSLKCAPFM